VKRSTNKIFGEIHVALDRFDLDEDKPAVDLIAWMEGPTLGDDTKDPSIWLTVKRADSPIGDSDAMFMVSIARMRALLDMAEAMHKVGDDGWKESIGEDVDE
jgi:hypothetical protein